MARLGDVPRWAISCSPFLPLRSVNRRHLLRSLPLGAALGLAGGAARATEPRPTTVRPRRLRPGDTVGLISPAGVTTDPTDIGRAQAALAALGLETVVAPHALAEVGYFAGTDEQRAADVTRMFADRQVDGILTMRGGWGCARLLPHLDFEVIRANPKVLCGFSDVTSLLLAITARTGLVTFHGPNATSNLNGFTGQSFRRVVMDADALTLANPPFGPDTPVLARYPTTTLRPGQARGPLLGGNLTVLASMVGTPFLPPLDGAILFVEDVGEAIYRIDRMLTQIGQAGLLDGIAGFVFGACNRCDHDSGDSAGFTLEEVIRQHIEPLGVPAYTGATIGHLGPKLTVPLVAEVEIDAEAGTLRLTAPAVM